MCTALYKCVELWSGATMLSVEQSKLKDVKPEG
jgi:hypothetical protein